MQVVTTYTYDPVSMRPRTVTVAPSNGPSRVTRTLYAHEAGLSVSSAMRTANMLAQVYRVSVTTPSTQELACSERTWKGVSGLSGTVYVPDQDAEGCGAEKQVVMTYETYDMRGRLLRQSDAGGAVTEIFYGTSAAPESNSTANSQVTAVRKSGSDLGAPLRTRYAYDTSGRLAYLYDENDRPSHFLYDGLGRLLEVRDTSDAVVKQHRYREAGAAVASAPNFVEVTTWTGASTRQLSREWFDGLGRPIQTAAVRSSTQLVVSQTKYDAVGRPWQAWKPVVRSVANAYTAAESFAAPATIDSETQTAYASFAGNGSGSLNRPFVETTYLAEPLNRPTYARDPGSADKGLRTLYGVARPDSGLTHPRGAVPSMAYVETRDADGRRTRTYTDGHGLTRFVRAGIGTAQETLTEQLYDTAGRLIVVRPPLYFKPRTGGTPGDSSFVTWYAYNTRGHVLTRRMPDAGVTRYKYDRMGRVRYEQDAQDVGDGNYVRYYQYDTMGRLTLEGRDLPQASCGAWAVLDPYGTCNKQGASYHFEYDGNAWYRMNVYDTPSVNQYNNPTRVQGWPWYGEASFAYTNVKGRLAASAYKSGGVWQSIFYAYDGMGRVRRQHTQSHGMTNPWERIVLTYDRAGQRLSQTVEVGTATTTASAFKETFVYNYQGQIDLHDAGVGTSGSTVSTAQMTNTEYLADGSVSQVTRSGIGNANSSGRVEARAYRIEGWLSSIGSVTSTAPAWTSPTTTMPSGYAQPYAVSIAYSAAGMITALDQRSPYSVLGSPYDAVSKAARYTYGFTYDGLGRLSAAEFGTSSTPAYAERGITYDANGNLLSLTRYSPTSATPSSWAQMDALSYGYWYNSNRLAQVTDAAQSAQWASRADDADNTEVDYLATGEVRREVRRFLSAAGQTEVAERWMSYDEQSLPLSVSVTEYASEDDYQEINPRSYQTIYYRYSGAGQRIYASTSAGVRRTIRGVGGEALGEFNGSGALVSWNLSGGQGRIAANGQRFFYVSDHLGSVRALVEGATGAVVEARDYYAWGLEMAGRVWVNGQKAREGYTGHQLDAETGWNYAGARYYAPALGRWMVMDPLAERFAAYSPYNYVLGNPLTLTDPDGKAPTGCKPPCIVPGTNKYYRETLNTAGRNFSRHASNAEAAWARGEYGTAVASGLKAAGSLALGALGMMDTGLLPTPGAVVGGASRAAAVARGGNAAARTIRGIRTPHGVASQAADAASMAARAPVQEGAVLYRIGTTGRSAAAEGQFWALESPLTPGFARRHGIPAENVAAADFIETATLRPGADFVTRPAPGIGTNAGGAIEVVVPANGVTMRSFHQVERPIRR